MSRVVANHKVRSVFSLDERDRTLLQEFSRALGINESQALVLAVQIANNLARKIAEGKQVGCLDEKGEFLDDSLTNTMLGKYQSGQTDEHRFVAGDD